MNRILYISLSVILFISCENKDREILVKLMQEWKGREILYPNDMHFFMQGRDTLNADSICMYKIITYIDSIGCMSCKLGLSQWQDFAVNVDSIFPNTVHFQFVFQPYKLNEIRLLLKRERFNHSVYIDKNNKFNKLNKFPSNMNFQTFLLDRNNRVIAIGNPIYNPKVKELYLKIIKGEKIERRDESKVIKTEVDASNISVSLGRFDWQEEQKATFILKNVGDKPLVIQDVATSCGCTTVAYSKEPALPGKEIDLEVVYKAEHPEHFDKTITVYCNAETSPLVLKISGDAK